MVLTPLLGYHIRSFLRPKNMLGPFDLAINVERPTVSRALPISIHEAINKERMTSVVPTFLLHKERSLRKGFAWFVRGFMCLISLYIMFCSLGCAFSAIECANNLIDDGFRRKYAELDVIMLPAALGASALLVALSCFLWKRQVRTFHIVTSTPLEDRIARTQAPTEKGQSRFRLSIGRAMILVLVASLFCGGLVLNRRSRKFFQLSWQHHSMSRDGHDGRPTPSPSHAAHHAALARKYESLARFPLWSVTPDPPDPE